MTQINEIRSLPVVAVTMGDGAGVGPEVIVGALLHPTSTGAVRPIVIGDATRLRPAAAIVARRSRSSRPIKSPTTRCTGPGRINVIDLDLLPDDLPWGELSAVAGNAAYQYVRVACEMAMRGEVQAICTAPAEQGSTPRRRPHLPRAHRTARPSHRHRARCR